MRPESLVIRLKTKKNIFFIMIFSLSLRVNINYFHELRGGEDASEYYLLFCLHVTDHWGALFYPYFDDKLIDNPILV